MEVPMRKVALVGGLIVTGLTVLICALPMRVEVDVTWKPTVLRQVEALEQCNIVKLDITECTINGKRATCSISHRECYRNERSP